MTLEQAKAKIKELEEKAKTEAEEKKELAKQVKTLTKSVKEMKAGNAELLANIGKEKEKLKKKKKKKNEDDDKPEIMSAEDIQELVAKTSQEAVKLALKQQKEEITKKQNEEFYNSITDKQKDVLKKKGLSMDIASVPVNVIKSLLGAEESQKSKFSLNKGTNDIGENGLDADSYIRQAMGKDYVEGITNK